MITHRDFLKISLNEHEIERLTRNAKITVDQYKKGKISGISRIYKDRKKREATMLPDAITGQAGTLALNIFTFGRKKGMIMYQKIRDIANANPTLGDKGEDILGKKVDIKCSIMRFSPDPMKYHLLVRPKEKHPNHIYIHSLIPEAEKTPIFINVYLTGWAYTDDLPSEVKKEGKCRGAYAINVPNLRPLRDYPEDNMFFKKTVITVFDDLIQRGVEC